MWILVWKRKQTTLQCSFSLHARLPCTRQCRNANAKTSSAKHSGKKIPLLIQENNSRSVLEKVMWFFLAGKRAFSSQVGDRMCKQKCYWMPWLRKSYPLVAMTQLAKWQIRTACSILRLVVEWSSGRIQSGNNWAWALQFWEHHSVLLVCVGHACVVWTSIKIKPSGRRKIQVNVCFAFLCWWRKKIQKETGNSKKNQNKQKWRCCRKLCSKVCIWSFMCQCMPEGETPGQVEVMFVHVCIVKITCRNLGSGFCGLFEFRGDDCKSASHVFWKVDWLNYSGSR